MNKQAFNKIQPLIIDDYNSGMKVLDILSKYNICRDALYKTIKSYPLMITIEKKRGRQLSTKLQSFDQQYSMFLEYMNMHEKIDKGEKRSGSTTTKTLCKKYEVSYNTLMVIIEEMRKFDVEHKRYEAALIERYLVFLKYRKQRPRNAEEQFQLFRYTYPIEGSDKDKLVKAYCNLHFRPYFNLCIEDGKEFLKNEMLKNGINTVRLDRWISFKRNNNKLQLEYPSRK